LSLSLPARRRLTSLSRRMACLKLTGRSDWSPLNGRPTLYLFPSKDRESS
ncbi:hypothetical protein T12_12446, partial [Trichinella patagoniensis]